jgi:hypothetical protein
MNNWQIAQALVFEPRRAFAELGERPRFWFPLLVLALTTTAISLWYIGVVDMEWLVDRQLHANERARQLGEERIAEMARMAADRRGLQAVLTGIFTPLAIGFAMLVSGVLYLLTSKVTNVQRGFRHWFALACWSSLPTALAAIASGFELLTAGSRQIDQGELQVLSLNALFFHRAPGEPGYTLLTYVSVLHFWAVYLAALAVKLWSGRSWLFSLLFTSWPMLLVFGIWGLLATGR